MDRVRIRDVGHDGMGRGQLVLRLGRSLLADHEVEPGIFESRRLDHHDIRHVGGEALVEPQVVEPAHRHEIAEPHVRHLVEDHLGPVHARGLGHPRSIDHPLRMGDTRCVLHRPGRELGDEELVVLPERIRVVEAGRVEVEPLLGDLENLWGIEVLGE